MGLLARLNTDVLDNMLYICYTCMLYMYVINVCYTCMLYICYKLQHMLQFMDPTDQLNFALSGLLKGFESINQVFPYLLKSVKFVNCLGRFFYNSWPIYQVVHT